MSSMRSLNIARETKDSLCVIRTNVINLRNMLNCLTKAPQAQGDSLNFIRELIFAEIRRLNTIIGWADNSLNLEYLPTHEELFQVRKMLEAFESRILDMEGHYDDFDVKDFAPEYFHRGMQKVMNGTSRFLVLLEKYMEANHQVDVSP